MRFEKRAVRSPSRRIARTRTVTLLPLAHRHARTVPESLRDFRLLIVVVPARAQRRPERVLVFRQTLNHDRRHALIHAKVRPTPARVLFRKLSHHLQVLIRRYSRLNARSVVSRGASRARPARPPSIVFARAAPLARRTISRRRHRRARDRSIDVAIVRSRAPSRRLVVANDVVARDLSTIRGRVARVVARAPSPARVTVETRVARARVGAIVTRVGAIVRSCVGANIVVVAECGRARPTSNVSIDRLDRSIDRSIDRFRNRNRPRRWNFDARDGGYGRRARRARRGARIENRGRARARAMRREISNGDATRSSSMSLLNSV